MQTIKYTFADGTTSEIEVTDEFYTLHLQLLQEEKRNHWKETRRHISLNYLTENGIDFESPAADPLSALLQSEDESRYIPPYPYYRTSNKNYCTPYFSRKKP